MATLAGCWVKFFLDEPGGSSLTLPWPPLLAGLTSSLGFEASYFLLLVIVIHGPMDSKLQESCWLNCHEGGCCPLSCIAIRACPALICRLLLESSGPSSQHSIPPHNSRPWCYPALLECCATAPHLKHTTEIASSSSGWKNFPFGLFIQTPGQAIMP
ncbi:hypothetical protein AXF42_Ash004023 [Apostasia shenzhenica]|uniref:Uncharacterized protein n=1 Tax=Apostasia shenzhenica TaxID=1088818 RepID=A0A2I0A1T7_9ASPA|nr:hypothetical protein AXF42_Ash004023 [Apostasia shenzhenica]